MRLTMKRAAVRFIVVAVMLLTMPIIAEAQQPKKVPRIGFLGAASASVLANRLEGFRIGLRELGYVEGKNIIIEWRYAEGKFDRLPALVDELLRMKVDVIVTTSSISARAARKA